jgi:hypothetical protein
VLIHKKTSKKQHFKNKKNVQFTKVYFQTKIPKFCSFFCAIVACVESNPTQGANVDITTFSCLEELMLALGDEKLEVVCEKQFEDTLVVKHAHGHHRVERKLEINRALQALQLETEGDVGDDDLGSRWWVTCLVVPSEANSLSLGISRSTKDLSWLTFTCSPFLSSNKSEKVTGKTFSFSTRCSAPAQGSQIFAPG